MLPDWLKDNLVNSLSHARDSVWFADCPHCHRSKDPRVADLLWRQFEANDCPDLARRTGLRGGGVSGAGGSGLRALSAWGREHCFFLNKKLTRGDRLSLPLPLTPPRSSLSHPLSAAPAPIQWRVLHPL